jgi:hypothetical protein
LIEGFFIEFDRIISLSEPHGVILNFKKDKKCQKRNNLWKKKCSDSNKTGIQTIVSKIWV